MNQPIDPRLTSHPMWSASDLRYLRGKGYDDDEIIRFWDRDHADGREPVRHATYEIEYLVVWLLGLSMRVVDEGVCEKLGIEADDLQRVLGIREVRPLDGREAGLVIEFEDGAVYRLPIQRCFNARR